MLYQATADELTNRIIALIETQPAVLYLVDPWKLFSFGLEVDDLQPSLFQAGWALREAQQMWIKRKDH